MPKMKTKRSAAKRFRLTATGKIRRGHASKSHMMIGKGAARLRNLRKRDIVSDADAPRVIRLIPYK